MAVKTNNKYGRITVSDIAVTMLANHIASECYGVVDLVSRRFTDSIIELFRKQSFTKGVRIETIDNKIVLELFVIIKDGVNVDAVCDALKNTVKYSVESFTGMRVKQVIVNVVGIKV